MKIRRPHVALFRPFSRTRGAQAGGQKGWGLGLTIVHGCAVAHGGRVRVESSERAGTTFTIDLPPDARPFQPLPEPSGEPLPEAAFEPTPDRPGDRPGH